MAKVYIPCAIDHGATNSSIAVMEATGPRVIKADGQNDVIPSAVYYSHRGRLLVGQAAAHAILTATDDGIGYTGYRARMGHDDRYEFPGGKVLTVPEMAGIVIGRLLQAYRDEGYPDYKAAVITVPAKFERPACMATMEAARYAGLFHSQLLLEPVAAALAHGFQSADKNAKWMILDLQDGTLDISLVVVRNGHCTVLPEGHTNDGFLDGRTFDRALLDYILGPRKSDPQYEVTMSRYRRLDPDYHPLRAQHALENFGRETRPNDSGTFLLAVEMAKIELFDADHVVIGGLTEVIIHDDNMQTIKVELPLARAIYERLIASDLERAVHTCKNLLTRNRLAPSEVQRLILIGGPGKTPYIQQVLCDRLGIPLAVGVDPLTAVVQGAAIFASTQEIPSDIVSAAGIEVSADEAKVRLEYDPSSKVPVSNVTGVIQDSDQPIEGWSVEIRRKDGLWSSGALPIDASGLFEVDVHLIEGSQPTPSQFETRIFDAKGQVVATRNEPEIWFCMPKGDESLPSDLMVALHGNITQVLLKQGVDLPAENSEEFVTDRDWRQGQEGILLRIPVYEGLEHFLGAVDPHADANVKVGELLVRGSDLKNDVPAGTTMEVTLRRDRNRQIRVHAFVRSLNQEFDAEFNAESKDPKVDDMVETFKLNRQRLDAIEKIDSEYPTPKVTEGLKALKELEALSQIERNLERTKEGDRESQSRCYRDILKLTGALYHLRDLQTEARLRRLIKYLEGSLEGPDLEKCETIRREFEQALQNNDKRTLVSIEESLERLCPRSASTAEPLAERGRDDDR